MDNAVLDVSKKTTNEAVWNGIGAVLKLGKAQTLT